MSKTSFDFQSVRDNSTDDRWLQHWESVWPSCKDWYLSEGLLNRPGYLTCLTALEKFMPELVPLYSRLNEKTGGTDLASRFLSLYNTPPFMAGCSQAVWDKEDLFLIKNYDYSDTLFEKTLFYSEWSKPVMGMLDCAWGLLDGINSDGLVASLTFGGKKVVGEGFCAPLIVRYILETSTTVKEAKIKIAKVPCNMAYNITLLDPSGDYTTVFLHPGKKAIFADDPVCTNHQVKADWSEYTEFSKTIERYDLIKEMLATENFTSEQLVQSFFEKPFFNVNFEKQFGTLYTALYRPKKLNLSLLWQNRFLVQSFKEFEESKFNLSIEDLTS